jgi:hypothetical protein
MRRFLIFILTPWSAAADEPRKQLEAFLEAHCYECHDDIEQEADLDLLGLNFDPQNPANIATWERVFRKVHEGEMPPKENKRPPGADFEGFLQTLGDPLHEIARTDIEKNGRVRSRRLTREEYENSLHDLLGISGLLQESLTADAEDGFTSTAAHQQISNFHLESYLNAADHALEEAFARALGADPDFSKRYRQKELTAGIGKGNYRGPQPVGKDLVSWSMGVQFYGRLPATDVPADGWYQVTIHDAQGINRGSDGAVWTTLNSGSGQSNEPLQYPIGLVEGAEKPTDQTFSAWIRKGHVLILKPSEGSAKRGRSGGKDGGTVAFPKSRNPEKEDLDGLRFSGITIERIHPNGNRPEIFENLFPGLTVQEAKQEPADPKAQLRRLLADFASRAFRRPLEPGSMLPYEKISLAATASGKPFPQALREGYHAILCSPRFLTFVEKPGQLDDHAIASRLSYMLWKSMPDEQLRKMADEAKLSNPTVLAQQIERLLADPKSDRFITSFTDQWLELRDMDATQPDPQRFSDFDPILQQSMVAETRAFFRELVSENLPVTNFLKSDFAFLNTRLSDHYGLGKANVIPGTGLQKTRLPPSSRSGLLTQGAVLKVTADGSVTSPVVRGVFVNERILGRHIDPPPPNIPAIEPDTRGAVSIRDQLDKHRNSANCASCHAKIDPAGFALEEFDPVGVVREFYGRPKKSAKVDPSGTTPEGEKFSNYDEWREIQLEAPEKLATAFVGQLLRYGTGGELRFSDRDILKKVTEEARKNAYGIRSLIKATVTSPLFLEK